jgi:hypothetical protein
MRVEGSFTERIQAHGLPTLVSGQSLRRSLPKGSLRYAREGRQRVTATTERMTENRPVQWFVQYCLLSPQE